MRNPSTGKESVVIDASTVIPFGWKELGIKLRGTWRISPKTAIESGLVRVALASLNQLSWAADDFLGMPWRNAEFEGPVFIIGHQRSGTTTLHRLIAEDHMAVRSLTLRDMLLPAISAQQGWSMARRVDKALSNPLHHALEKGQNRWFGPLDHLHRMRFNEVEEDEIVLWNVYASAMCANDSPHSVIDPALDHLRRPELWTKRRRERVLYYYRDCLQKKAYSKPTPTGQAPWMVCKNPAFCQKIPLLREVFSGARFIYLIRDPREAIASRLSLIRAIWRHRFPNEELMNPERASVIVDDSIANYTFAERDLALVPPDRKLLIRFTDLIEDPGRIVRMVRGHFVLPSSGDVKPEPVFRERKDAKSNSHTYNLEEFGICPQAIENRLRFVLDAHGFH
jgi:hypothetical protein